MSMVNQSILLKWIILIIQTCIETVCSVSELECICLSGMEFCKMCWSQGQCNCKPQCE